MKVKRFFDPGVFTAVNPSGTARKNHFKRILFLPVFTLAFTFHSHAQEKPANSSTLTPIEQDSLAIYQNAIDRLNAKELAKVHESYLYKCRVAPTEMKRQILAYVEKRINKTK